MLWKGIVLTILEPGEQGLAGLLSGDSGFLSCPDKQASVVSFIRSLITPKGPPPSTLIRFQSENFGRRWIFSDSQVSREILKYLEANENASIT